MAWLSPRTFTFVPRHRAAWIGGSLIALCAVGLAGACSDATTSYSIASGAGTGGASGSTTGMGSGSASGRSTSGGSTTGTAMSGGSSGSTASGSSGATSGAGGGSGNGGTMDAGNTEGGAGDDGSADGADATGCPFDPTKTSPGVCGCGTPDNASGDVTGDGGID
ncbi:MAG TPA: hypothetical protein VGY54_23355, partial [Polyangiaceae bacterium]|nr:hypothetical protein [Polyangiaceae bacterium]